MKMLLICDLDGTLVDSFPGISASLQQACTAVGITPAVALDRSLIGPPLSELLPTIAGSTDEDTVECLRRAFLAAYDGGLCCLASPFDGVEEMLRAVRARGHSLALATNKRHAPTERILRHLGWSFLFQAVETTDSRPGKSRTKAGVLKDICADFSRCITSAMYLGDMDADVEAAREAGMRCIMVAWGYGGGYECQVDLVASTPSAVESLLVGASTKM